MTALRAPRRQARLPASLLAILFVTAPEVAHADGLAGTWKQSALRETYTPQAWAVELCGPAPVSASTGGGESVTVTEAGDELTFAGGGRTFNSRQCYDTSLPSLARESHSHDPSARTWRTRCVTPPRDPRRATLNTLVQATSDNRIQITETGRYEATLDKGKCIADVVRMRSFDLVVTVAPPAVASASVAPPPLEVPTATAPPARAPRNCASPGEPTQLQARPARKLLKQGSSFVFEGLVLDASGCATRTPTTWAVSNPASGVSVDAAGKVSVAADAPEGDTAVTISSAGKTTHVTVAVTSALNYDDLLARSGLNASGESESASTVTIASGSVGGGEGRADDGARKRKTLFIALVVALAGALGVVALVGRRRAKRGAALAREAEERHAEQVREIEQRKRRREMEHAERVSAHERSVRNAAEHAEKQRRPGPSNSPMVCGACRREFPPDSTFCPTDGNRLVPMNASAALPSAPGGVCPSCRRGFDVGVKTCPEHGEELVPAALLATSAPALPKVKGRICPTCGARFGPQSTFCGADGTALVLLN